MEQNRKTFIIRCVQLVLLLAILGLMVQPVETSWSNGEWWLVVLLPVVLFVVGGLYLLFGYRWRWSVADCIVVCWTSYVFVLTLWGWTIVTPTAFLRWMEIVVLYVGLRYMFFLKEINEKYLAWGLVVVCLYEVGQGCLQFVDGNSRHALYPVTGCFLNPGPYAAFLAVGASVMLGLLKSPYVGNVQRNVLQMSLLITLSFMLIGFSRAAILAFTIVALFVYRSWVRHHLWVLAVLAFVVLVLCWLKFDSAAGRLVIWRVACSGFLDHALVGNGLGGFPYAYAQWSADYFSNHPTDAIVADVCDNAFNELVTIGVEQGLVGVAMCLVLFSWMGKNLYERSLPLFSGFVALIVFSLFSYPFQCLPFRILFVFLLAYVGSVQPKGSLSMMARIHCLVVVALVVGVSIGLARELGQRKTATDEYGELAGLRECYFVEDYYRLLPMLDDNPSFLFDFGKQLSALGRYNDSNAILKKGTLVSGDPMFYVCMGNNYVEMSLFNKAERLYIQAFRILPNRLYPLYKLMKLYETTHQDRKCYVMAKRIGRFQEKICSSATKVMKREANLKCIEYERK